MTNCVKCNKGFISSKAYYQYCPSCRRKMVPKANNHQLPVKNEIVRKCMYCWKITNQYGECSNCQQICKDLRNGTYADVYPDYKVQITYDVESEEHDGYCSDPGKITTTHSTVKRNFPLMKAFKQMDINGDNTIDDVNKTISRYYSADNAGWVSGSCYCGRCETIYTISKVVVIKKRSDCIILDD